MINSVRETVLSVLNKNNYGYVSPQDFNLFAKQAQLDLFEDIFYQYNYQINKETARQSGTGYANITKGIVEVIDLFSVLSPLTLQQDGAGNNVISNIYQMPSELTTGSDYYLINKVLCYNNQLVSSTTTGNTDYKLVDNTQNFTSTSIPVGSLVVNINSANPIYAYVTAVDSTSVLSLSANVMGTIEDYVIYNNVISAEAEKVSQSKINMLINSSVNMLTSPTALYPAYTTQGSLISLYPVTINQPGQVFAQYIRYPADPQWTFATITGNEPVFNEGAANYQDFELPEDYEPDLVTKILSYSGMSIREIQIAQYAESEENMENQTER